MRSLVALAIALALVLPANARPRLKKPPAKQGFQTRVGEYSIAPGEDLEVCEYRRLPNAKPMDVQRFKLRMPLGAHHFAVWTYGGDVTDDGAFPSGPVPSVGCVGIAPGELVPQLLVPTQTPNAEFRFPKGVALRLDARQQVFLNPHMKNFGAEPITPDIRFNVYRAKKGTVKHYAEGLTFGNSSDIKIPANGEQTLVVDWTLPITLTIVHLSTHQHARGTHAKVELAREDGSGRDLLVESYDWEHPSSVWPEGGLRLEQGRTLRLTCSWRNEDDHEVGFGPETTDEMCYGVGFAYRDPDDPTPLVGSGCIPSKKGVLCPIVPAVSD
jgi:hypothetical protein